MGEEELLAVHRLALLVVDLLPALVHVGVGDGGLVAHASLLQVEQAFVVGQIVTLFEHAADHFDLFAVELGLHVVALLARHAREVVTEGNRETFLFLSHVLDFSDLNLEQGVRGHHRGDLAQEDVVVNLGEVAEAFQYRQIVVLFEQFQEEVALRVRVWVYVVRGINTLSLLRLVRA